MIFTPVLSWLLSMIDEKADYGQTQDETPVVSDGTYTVGKGTSQDGTITVKDGLIIDVQEAEDT